MREFPTETAKPKSRNALRAAVSIPIIGAVLYLLSDYLTEVDTERLGAAIAAISPLSIVLATVFTAISLYAVAGYDRLAARQMGLDIPDAKTREGGFAAVAISQAAGFGVLTGSFVRWRMYRPWGLSYAQAVGVTALVIAGFTVGFVGLLSVAVVFAAGSLTELTGLSALSLRLVAGAGLLLVSGYLALSLCQPRLHLMGRSIPIPRFRLIRSQMTLAVCDLVPAAAALWVLIPAEGGVTLTMVIPVYLAALFIGMVSNVPGGLGVLELACLMALPVMPPENLLAALIVYRGVYYAGPALLGVAMLAAREFGRAPEMHQSAPVERSPEAALRGSDKAETMFAHLGDKRFVVSACGKAALMYGVRGNSLVALGDPIGPRELWPSLVSDFDQHARAHFSAPVFYKISSDFAGFLKGKGFATARSGMNGVLDPSAFRPTGSKFSRLRRSLRASERAGVEVTAYAPGQAALGPLAPVARAWVREKGGERGFSMGYCSPDYLNRQSILVARVEGDPVGFISLAHAPDHGEFALDLVRLTPDAPQGTMQALTVCAIDFAREAGAARFSLAGIPLGGIDTPEGVVEQALIRVRERFGDTGLYQFKSAFRPDWEVTYTAAPNPAALACGLRDTYLLVQDGPAVSPEETGRDYAPSFA